MDNGFFKNIEKKTGVNMKDIFDLANSLQNANFKDEKTVRNVIRRVSQIANKPVNKDMEDQIVKSIVNDGKQLDFNTIAMCAIPFLVIINHAWHASLSRAARYQSLSMLFFFFLSPSFSCDGFSKIIP
jgi:hypothetical protein